MAFSNSGLTQTTTTQVKGRSKWQYKTTDAKATVVGSAYFTYTDGLVAQMVTGDKLEVECDDGSGNTIFLDKFIVNNGTAISLQEADRT